MADEQKSENSGPARDPRIRLAAERTLLAWIRTSLAMMGFGFVIARFGLFLRELAVAQPQHAEHTSVMSLWLGTALLVLGVFINLASSLEYRSFLKRYERGDPDRVPRWSLGITSALLLAVLGFGLIGYLVTLRGL